jgi:hypothetical protein
VADEVDRVVGAVDGLLAAAVGVEDEAGADGLDDRREAARLEGEEAAAARGRGSKGGVFLTTCEAKSW